MIVESQVTINASKEAIWARITDFDNAAKTIKAIDNIEILESPTEGLVGLKWRETRTLLGKTATEEMRITDADPSSFYTARAASNGFVYLTTVSIADQGSSNALSIRHESKPQSLILKLLSVPLGLVFKGVAKKAFLKDLNDIKAAVESGQGEQAV